VSCLNLVTEKREMNAWIASIRSPISIGRDDPRFRCFDLAQNDRYQSLLMVPIVARDRVVGVLILQCDKGRPYNQDEIQFLMTAGLLLGAAVEIVILEDKNSQLTDQLETRKLVERAKGILQRDLKISEEDAYAALRRESSRKRKPMRDLAEAILFNDDFRRGLKSNGQS
jgi:uroporphyrinogen-III synthase